jgi:hypothetical protein
MRATTTVTVILEMVLGEPVGQVSSPFSPKVQNSSPFIKDNAYQ